MSYEHPTLGAFEYREHEGGWVGRHGRDGGFSDLIVLVDSCDHVPSAAAIESLTNAVRDLVRLSKDALTQVRKYRREILRINEGPPDSGWTVESIIADQGGLLTLDLYEGETDEYSKWRACFRDGGVVVSREPA